VEVAHAFDFYTNLTLIPAAKLAGVPVVIGSHRQLGDLMTAAQFRAQAIAFRWCDAVVCNSQAAADRLISAGISSRKIAIIGNALAAEAFAGAAAVLPKRAGVTRIGMVARMNHRYKNQSGFLQIAARIHSRMPDVEFVLAGDGPLRPELEREAVSLGLGASAIFLGDRQDMSAVLASLDIAVNTSDSESLSNVVLEAMAAGLPTVAYDVGGNAELIGKQIGTTAGTTTGNAINEASNNENERGTLVAAGDENGFAEAVQNLLSDPALRERMGSNARQFVKEQFSLDRVRQRYVELYSSLLRKKRRGKPAA
jgi:glycosyltransferase involved in cell wall biosynthesis